MRVPVEDMTFVIRAAPEPGERTLPAAEGLLRELVVRSGGDAREQVTVVRERPFAAAVRRTYEIGLDARRPWIVAVDADVLLLSDAVERLGGFCAAVDGATFTVAALMLCKFYGGFCFRGIHCYPRRLLDRALRLFDFCGAKDCLKPESAVVKAMEREGFRAFAPPVPVGVHDHEQWLRHVYVKMRMRGRREMADGAGGGFAAQLAVVQQAGSSDPDLLVAAWGLDDGRRDSESGADSEGGPPAAHYKWDASMPELERRMREHGVREKPPWTGGARQAQGYAERVMGAHAFAADQRTPKWIRERLGFEHGTEHALRRIGIAPVRRAEGTGDDVRTLPLWPAQRMGEVA